MNSRISYVAGAILAAILAVSACQTMVSVSPAASDGQRGERLVIYSGRGENLIQPIIEQFKADTGIDVEVRYAGTAELAATLLEEGDNTPADIFFSQDAGALGALAEAGRLETLPSSILEQVDAHYRSAQDNWVGITGRARVLVFNTNNVDESELPADIHGLVDPKWKGRIGWAPTNASFQAFVTALRVLEGEDAAREWLNGMIANDVQFYDGNTAVVNAAGTGEIDLGLVNHYYLFQFLKEQGEGFPARNYYFPTPGAGTLVNIAGVGVLKGKGSPATDQFINYMLSNEAQQYFATETVEYPLTASVTIDPRLKPLEEIAVPNLDMGSLRDLQGTLQLLQDTGAIQ